MIRRRRLAVVAALAASAGLLPLVSQAAEAPATAPPAGEWLAGDLHVHTTFSHDSYGGPGDDNTGLDEANTAGLTVGQQFSLAATRGLDFLAITDHNDVRSQSDPGFGVGNVVPIRGYENSLHGHAQMLGAGHVYDNGDASPAEVAALADALRADGGAFQANHPVNLEEMDWEYGYDVQPDTVEVWNITTLWQPPMPSSSDKDGAVRYWEGWLDRGAHVAVRTGGSDTHWAATAVAQGVGQPTTWVYASSRTEAGVLEGIRAGRTFISWQPPALGGPRLFLEADADGDGVYEAMVGDTVPAGAALRARAEGAPGAVVRLIGTGGAPLGSAPVTSPSFAHDFTVPAGTTWVRAELVLEDAARVRKLCDPLIGKQTTYCRNRIALVAMTSALYLTDAPAVSAVDGSFTLENGLVSRTWSLSPFRTERLVDLRTGRVWSEASNDFTLTVGGVDIRGDSLSSAAPRTESLPNGGTRATFDLGVVDRVVEVYPGVAGYRSRTVVKIPGVLSGYTLDELAVGPATVTTHGFQGGADWREGDWHEVNTERAQWLSAVDGSGASAFLVMERNDYASSTMAYDGAVAAARVDLSRDVIYVGPFEEQIHVENPGPGPARSRVVVPPLELESVFTGVAVDADDEPWQHYAYLSRYRGLDYRNTVTFNSDSVDGNRISTGAKDDMDLAEVQRQAAVARELGVETFILDDGWQARSGDWCPDSPECPEPRFPQFPHRFPDATFTAVRDALGPDMELGLWMSPMSFNPSSETFRANPLWSSAPVGTGTAVANLLTPDDGSNEAGIGLWGVAALPHIESRIRTAIESWGVRYFKFDFLVWLDCIGAEPSDTYQYKEAFVSILDRLIADYPDVVFQIDETNDYRLFPFESVARGPSWFQNGSPHSPALLHNLWSLNPWVPGSSIGQHTFGGDERSLHSIDYLMAVALPSHLTFKTDLTKLSASEVATAREWVDVYKANRDALGGFAYPLLDDPVSGTNWTALQPWDLDAQRGMLLVYRQDAEGDSTSVPLRGLRASQFRVSDARTGEVLGVFSRDDLAGPGLLVTLPDRFSAAVLVVESV